MSETGKELQRHCGRLDVCRDIPVGLQLVVQELQEL